MHVDSHAQALAKIHFKAGALHLLPVKPVERLGLSHFKHVAPAARAPLSQVLEVFLRVGLGVALHRRDAGRGNSLFVEGGDRVEGERGGGSKLSNRPNDG